MFFQSEPRRRAPADRLLARQGRRAGCDLLQATSAPAREDAHDAEADVEQRQRVGDEGAHAPHAADGAEHAGRAVRAPHDGEAREYIARQGVHREEDAHERGQHQRQQTVAEHRGGAREGQVRGRGLVLAVGVARGRGCRVVVVRRVRVVVGVERWWRHQRQNYVEGGAPEYGEAVDVTEVYLAGLYEERSAEVCVGEEGEWVRNGMSRREDSRRVEMCRTGERRVLVQQSPSRP